MILYKFHLNYERNHIFVPFSQEKNVFLQVD